MTTPLSSRTFGAPSAPGPIPFSQHVRVEWAKATDTRVARWLLALVGAISSYLLYVLVNVLAAVALGALLQSSAAAIAASFALPAAFALLGTASTLVSEWIDMSTPWHWVLENDWGGHVPQISVSILFWLAVPFAAGVVRTIRRDVG